MVLDPGSYEIAVFVFQRALGLVYLLAFLIAVNQFKPLLGENGILPFTAVIDRVSFRERPSIFHFVPSDRAVTAAAWAGVVLSLFAVTGMSELFGTAVSMLIWFLLWALYQSFVNVGRVFYGFGWESMLLETGFLAIFLGGLGTATPFVMVLLLHWVLFRNMFGAGLIKLRGDPCWKKLTCMDYHYETQPLPNPLSWYADKLPDRWHRLEVLGNHLVELVVPFLYFAPQPVAAVGGAATIGHMGWLMLTGNYAFLNFLTIVLAIPLFSDGIITDLLPVSAPATTPPPDIHLALVYGVVVIVAALSIRPVRNMLSSQQVMNTSFDPLHLVNTYGAFGSITTTRYQIVIEGTQAEEPDEDDWVEYTFKSQPVKLDERPPQVAPYHYRLDWQLWFAAMTPRPQLRQRWFIRLMEQLLENDPDTCTLIDHNPFPADGPEHLRAIRYTYAYTDPAERQETGYWWKRERLGTYYGPISRDD